MTQFHTTFYYTISNCLITLHQLNYESDINSTDKLCEAIQRLNSRFYGRWGEHYLKLHSIREPRLIDLETWLSERIQTSTDPYLLPKQDNNSQRNLRQDKKCKTHIHTTQVKGEPSKTTENKCSRKPSILQRKPSILQVSVIFNHGTIRKI